MRRSHAEVFRHEVEEFFVGDKSAVEAVAFPEFVVVHQCHHGADHVFHVDESVDACGVERESFGDGGEQLAAAAVPTSCS